MFNNNGEIINFSMNYRTTAVTNEKGYKTVKRFF